MKKNRVLAVLTFALVMVSAVSAQAAPALAGGEKRFMDIAFSIIFGLAINGFFILFFPLRINKKFKQAGVKGARKHNVRIIVCYVLFLLLPIVAAAFLRGNAASPAGSLLSIPSVVFLVLYIVFIVKGMKAGNAAIRGTSPAAPITQMAAGAELPGLKCPRCGSPDFQPLGAKGYKGRLVANIILGWLVSRILEGKIGNTVVYHCNNCKTKWEAAPAPAGNGERLEQPCKIEVTRPGNFVGAIVGQFVYLNGEKIGRLDSGKTVAFSTSYRNNILFITDMTGTAFKEFRRFEAKPGEHIAFNFNRKFL